MGLLDKVRILVGALVHKPFSPRPEKADLGEGEGGREGRGSAQAGGGMEAEPQPVPDEERVADLLARREDQEEG
jgi:hypothetical protein